MTKRKVRKIEFHLESEDDENLTYKLEADNLQLAHIEALKMLGYYIWWEVEKEEAPDKSGESFPR